MVYVCGDSILIRSSVCSDSNDKLYEFRMCGELFQFSESYRYHKQAHECPEVTTTVQNESIGSFEVEIVNTEANIEDSNKCRNKNSEFQSENIQLKCKKRSILFSKESTLKGHFCSDPSDKSHKCLVCGESFTFSSELGVHTEALCNQTSWSCRRCGKDFDDYSLCKNHLLNNCNDEPEEMTFTCNICEKKFTNIDLFVVHELSHMELGPCRSNCNGTGRFVKNTNLYYRYWGSTTMLTSPCPFCGKSYCSPLFLRKHMMTCPFRNNEVDTMPFVCNICGCIFSFRNELNIHVQCHIKQKVRVENSKQKKNKKSKPFLCEICGKFFGSNSNLYMHSLRHTKELLWLCDVCGRGFSQKTNLVVHKKSHIPLKERVKPHVCTFCNKAFMQPYGLKLHLRSHTKEKPFMCNICGKRFAYRYCIPLHKRIHSKEKPFKCEVCERTFNQPVGLNSHLLTHTGELPFECTICHKKFNQRMTLKMHYRTHTREKAFLCKICGQRFADRLPFNRHKAIHQLVAKKQDD